MPELFFGPAAWAPLNRALVAYVEGDETAMLAVHSDEGEPDSMPVSLFFRSREALREVDRKALNLVRGTVLDVGAGVGAVSLILQEDGIPVMAMEVMPGAVEIMVGRGVRHVWKGRIEDYPLGRRFDTVLLLMNGSALAGTLAGLSPLLETLAGLLAPGGQVLMDSTDLLGGEGRGWEGPAWEGSEYPGEVQYQMEFRGETGAPSPQLFVDPTTLGRVAGDGGWRTEVVWQGSGGEYLARLVRVGPVESDPG